MRLFGIELSKTAIIIFVLLLFMFVLPPLFMILYILYTVLTYLQTIRYLFSFWRGLGIIVFLSSDITFFILSDEKKSLIPWNNKIAQIVYTCFIIFYILMNIIKFF